MIIARESGFVKIFFKIFMGSQEKSPAKKSAGDSCVYGDQATGWKVTYTTASMAGMTKVWVSVMS